MSSMICEHLPAELADARAVLADRDATVAEGEAEAQRIIADAGNRAGEKAGESAQAQRAEEQATKIVENAQSEAAALRREADVFVDSRMAIFESVLAKTGNQVRTARRRLAEPSMEPGAEEQHEPELPDLD